MSRPRGKGQKNLENEKKLDGSFQINITISFSFYMGLLNYQLPETLHHEIVIRHNPLTKRPQAHPDIPD